MKKLLLLFFLISITIPTNAYYPNYNSFNKQPKFTSKLKMNQPKVRIDNHRNYNLNPYYNNSHCHHHRHKHHLKNNLSNLERHALNRRFHHENDLKRLERLENLTFGSIQSGDLESRYHNLERAIYSRPRYGTKQSVIGKIANYLNGDVTGFTPSLTPNYFSPNFIPGISNGYTNLGGFNNNFYPAPGYTNNNFEQYSNGIFSKGFGISEDNYGTGSSIRILD